MIPGCSENPALAERYDRLSDSQLEKGLELVKRMGVKPGDRVLDVGCGTGRLTLQVSEIIGASGCILGIDPSEPRIAMANGKLKGHAPENARFEIGRAEDLSALPDSSFNHVYYSSVFHWIRDKKAALREAFRVLAPGGAIGMTTAIPCDEHNVQAIMDRLFALPPYAGRVDVAAAARQSVSGDELRKLLAEAGFTGLEVVAREKRRVLPSSETALEQAEANSAGNLLEHVPESLRDRARRDIIRGLEAFRTPAGVELSTSSQVAVAVKPK